MKILIAFATRFGTTEKCAGMLAELLKEKDYEVEFANLKKDKNVSIKDYALVVLGGSFLMARMNNYVNNFVKKNLNELINKKTALFMCGADENWEAEIKKGFPEKLLDSAVAKGYFGYELNWDKMNSIFKNMMKKASEGSETTPKIITANISKFADEIRKALS